MKKIYVFLLFLIFFNIFNLMFYHEEIFTYEHQGEEGFYDLSADDENITSSENVLENVTGSDWTDIFGIFLFDINSDSTAGLLISIAFLGGAIALAWLTHSPAPLVVGFTANVLLRTYTHSIGVFEGFPVDDYIMLALGIGMLFLLVITSAEYLTQGDA